MDTGVVMKTNRVRPFRSAGAMRALQFVTVGFALGAAPAAIVTAAQQADAKTHLQWMDDAGDAQEDLRDAFAKKDAAQLSEGAAKLTALMTQTERYWTSKKASADVLKVAKESRELAAQMGAAAGKKDLDGAQKAFDTLSGKCNACHDLHPEKR
jgi:hypothetical protein